MVHICFSNRCVGEGKRGWDDGRSWSFLAGWLRSRFVSIFCCVCLWRSVTVVSCFFRWLSGVWPSAAPFPLVRFSAGRFPPSRSDASPSSLSEGGCLCVLGGGSWFRAELVSFRGGVGSRLVSVFMWFCVWRWWFVVMRRRFLTVPSLLGCPAHLWWCASFPSPVLCVSPSGSGSSRFWLVFVFFLFFAGCWCSSCLLDRLRCCLFVMFPAVCLLCCGCVLGLCSVMGLGSRLFKVSLNPLVIHCSAALFWLCLLCFVVFVFHVLCFVLGLGSRQFRSPLASWWFSVQLSFYFVCVAF